MLVITVVRKPLDPATPTVAQNALRHGTGGINVDATRIGSDPSWNTEPSVRYRASSMGTMGSLQTRPWVQNAVDAGKPVKVTTPSKLGRWPSNLILSHLAGCKPAGTKKVKKPGGDGNASVGRNSNPIVTDFGITQGKRVSHYAEDGTETVQVYDCQPGCPVAALDDTTEPLHAAVSVSRPKHYNATSYQVGDASRMASFTDSGGASRFFKIVQNEPDL